MEETMKVFYVIYATFSQKLKEFSPVFPYSIKILGVFSDLKKSKDYCKSYLEHIEKTGIAINDEDEIYIYSSDLDKNNIDLSIEYPVSDVFEVFSGRMLLSGKVKELMSHELSVNN